jgi:hypothetical protein
VDAADPRPDPFEMSHMDLMTAVAQLWHFEDEAKEMVRWMAERTGMSETDVNKELAARLAKRTKQ